MDEEQRPTRTNDDVKLLPLLCSRVSRTVNDQQETQTLS